MPEATIRALPFFDSLTESDQRELLRFDRYLDVVCRPVQPIEGAYAHIYGEVVYEADWPCMRVSGAWCRHGECKP